MARQRGLEREQSGQRERTEGNQEVKEESILEVRGEGQEGAGRAAGPGRPCQVWVSFLSSAENAIREF